MDLRGRTRFKDGQSRYWCPECNEKDQLSKQPATCPDCQREFTRADLTEFKGTPVCKECWEKRRQSAKREEARLRAVEEAIREEQEKRQRMKMWGAVLVIVVAVWAIAWLIVRII